MFPADYPAVMIEIGTMEVLTALAVSSTEIVLATNEHTCQEGAQTACRVSKSTSNVPMLVALPSDRTAKHQLQH